jgi:uncharacterized phage protein (TIGR01671 family)
MRKIEFRGKRKDNGEWAYGYLSRDNEIAYSHAVYNGAEVYQHVRVAPETVGQYTELRDMSDHGIFEGDILGFSSLQKPLGFGRRYAVELVNGAFCAFLKGKRSGNPHRDDLLFWALQLEALYVKDCAEEYGGQLSFGVIGNVHDNPELIEE